jgi:FkbM family methyltransferase
MDLRRSPANVLSVEALRHVRYIPRIVRRVRPWPRFLLTYMRLLNDPADYTIDGLRFHATPVDVSTLAVVLIKDDYGASAPTGTVVDIGAHIGAYAIRAGRTATVHAYEPAPATYRQLEANVARNGARVHTHQLGVAGASGTRHMALSPHGSPFNTIYGSEGTPVECVTLDGILGELERCDTLKIDCEGAEFEILAGCSLLHKVQEIWLEYHEGPGRRLDDLFASLHDFDVESWVRSDPQCGTLHLRRR